ncbi:MAG TPA: hypothetical protein VMV22_02115 [Acidimicrobiales bacterium]|nr:hypothetical protein [Acidimicrobiales bacterium]
MQDERSRHDESVRPADVAPPGRIRPLAYAVPMLVVFVTTVIVLAVKAGADAAMLTTLFAVTLGGTALGLWGTAMAVREIDGHREPVVDRGLAEQPSTRSS